MLLDAHGKPVSTKILKREVAGPDVVGWRSPWTQSAASFLTPQRLSAYLAQANQGNLDQYLTLAEEMEERDLHYRSVLQTRKLAVAALDIQVERAGENALQKEQAEQLRALSKHEAFYPCLLDLLDAIGKGYSVVEINWRIDGEPPATWYPSYAWRDPRWFEFDRETLSDLRLRAADAGQGMPLTPYKFIVHLPHLKTGLPVRSGLARVACWAFLFKSYSVKDWAAFMEVYGMPLRIGRYGENASAEDKSKLRNALISLGSDAAALLGDGMKIEFQDAVQGRGGEALFKEAAEWWDKQVSKLVLGQTASSEGTPGKLGESKAQADVRQDLLAADARMLSATLNRDLVKPFIDLNWGVPKEGLYPRITLALPKPDNTAKVMDAVARLAPLGLQVEQQALREMLGLAEPGAGAAVLGASMPQPAPAKASQQALAKALLSLAQNSPQQKQSDLDALAEEAAEDWEPLLAPLLEPLVQAVQAAKDPADLERLLAQTLPQSDTAPLAKAIASATFKARGLGDGED